MPKEKQKDWYAYQEKIHLAVDCIIFGFTEGKLKLLVFKRKVEPLSGHWSLIGAIVKNDERVDDAAKRVLYELTGLENIFLKESKCYSAVDRDPGDRCVSISHYALIRLEKETEQLIEDHGAHWFEFNELPSLVLDHDLMVADALKELKKEARRRPIGFELLPKKFTIPQLQALYEAIYGTSLDARNFRKKVLKVGVLQKLSDKDFSTSKKGAYLYRFDKKKYYELIASGYDFVL